MRVRGYLERLIGESSPDDLAGLVADYCGLLREAAFVVGVLCEAPFDQRDEEFNALIDVEAESRATYEALLVALSSGSDTQQLRDLTALLHAMFKEFLHVGATLRAWNAQQLPSRVVRRWGAAEDSTWSLVRSWENTRDPLVVAAALRAIQLEVLAIDEYMTVAVNDARQSPRHETDSVPRARTDNHALGTVPAQLLPHRGG